MVLPSLPEIFRIVRIINTTVELEWSLVEGVDAYIIVITNTHPFCESISGRSQTLVFTQFEAPLRNSTIIRDLEEGTEYSVELYTLNEFGRSAESVFRQIFVNAAGKFLHAW